MFTMTANPATATAHAAIQAAVQAALHAAAATAPGVVDRDADALPGGCGWFDSSLDLSRGLAVVEHAGFDGLGEAVPMAWQLAAWL